MDEKQASQITDEQLTRAVAWAKWSKPGIPWSAIKDPKPWYWPRWLWDKWVAKLCCRLAALAATREQRDDV